jgi:hypothetical protein
MHPFKHKKIKQLGTTRWRYAAHACNTRQHLTLVLRGSLNGTDIDAFLNDDALPPTGKIASIIITEFVLRFELS